MQFEIRARFVCLFVAAAFILPLLLFLIGRDAVGEYAIGACVSTVFFWYLTRPLAAMEQAANELQTRVAAAEESPEDDFSKRIVLPKSTQSLYDRVNCRTRERDATNEKLEELVKELQRQRDKAELADKAKTQFLATMSHEMKTPLHWINGYAGWLRRTELTPRQNECVNKLFEGISLLKRLIGDVLDYQKILLGGMTIETESVDLLELSRKVADSMQAQAREKGNKLVLECEVDSSLVVTDRARVEQILGNLIGNACKFTENGEITLTLSQVAPERLEPTREDCGDYLVSVSDTGIGMSEQWLERLFTPFETGKGQGNITGTGLGLVICKELCTLLGGRIDVESTEGQGSTFTVRLPVSTPNAEECEWKDSSSWAVLNQPQVDGESSAERQQRVLIIDDDPRAVEILTEELAETGCQTWSANDGVSGLELARKIVPDLITLDIVMPETDGWDVLRRLKEDAVTKNIPVVLVTILSEIRKGMALGANGYLPKPFQPDELREVVRQLLGARGTVLIVDDDAESRELARDALAETDFEIAEAKDGEEALDSILHSLPDAIVLDLNMPRMTGFELVEQLKIRGLSSRTKILIVTGRSLTRGEKETLSASVAGFVDKASWDSDKLRAEVCRHLELAPPRNANGGE